MSSPTWVLPKRTGTIARVPKGCVHSGLWNLPQMVEGKTPISMDVQVSYVLYHQSRIQIVSPHSSE